MTRIHDSEETNASGGSSFRVIDFTRYMPGPLATRLLADLGADVIKVENTRTGDATRGFAPYIHDQGLFHVCLNPGKRSLAIESRSPEWPRVIQALARSADVFIVGGLPEGLGRQGIDFESIVKINPRIVHCNVTGYGEEGPMRGTPAHGLNPDAMAGIVPIEWREGLPFPQEMYQSAGAPLSGVFAALGVMAALRRRDTTGEPQRLTVSMLGTAIWWNWRHAATYANLGHPWFSYAGFGGRYATYQTSDDKIVLVCPIEKVFWEAFCDLLGLPAEWRARGTWGRSEMDHGIEYPWERAEIAALIRKQTRAHWETEFNRIRIPYAAILSLEESLASEQAKAIGTMREVNVDGAIAKIPSNPIRFISPQPLDAPPLRTPALGEHTAEILRELGVEMPPCAA